MSRFGLFVSAAVAAISSLVAIAPSASAAACAPFPKVSVWGDYSHERVKDIVNSRLGGNWDAYTRHLDQRLALIKTAQRQGKTMAIEFEGVRYLYNGDELARYERAAERRQSIVQCLAQEAAAEKLQQSSTAAGPGMPSGTPMGTRPGDNAPFTEIAGVPAGGSGAAIIKGDGFDLALETTCAGGNAIFKFTNSGLTWPMRGTIGIYRLGKGEPLEVQARSLRFNGGQSITINVPASKNPTGMLGAFVNPAWVRRPFAIDRALNCQ